jgi:hypothetical protein
MRKMMTISTATPSKVFHLNIRSPI